MKKTSEIILDERKKTLDGALAAFFVVMLAGYAGGDRAVGLRVLVKKEKNKHKVTAYFDGYKIEDKWNTFPNSQCSEGVTTIYYNDSPIWRMHYGGNYPEKVIPFLKKMLASSYNVRSFRGGRGPFVRSNTEYEYHNNPLGDFYRFSGQEKILDFKSKKLLGYHDYFGMALI